MKTKTVTIRLDESLEGRLDDVCRVTGKSRSVVVRDALERQLSVQLLDEARRKLMPLAEAKGYLTDEDIFRDIS